MKTAKYFSASWCGPCKMFKPVVNELIDEGHAIEIVDVDDDQELALKYQVMSVPTIVFEEVKVAHVISVVLIVGVVTEAVATKLSTCPEIADKEVPVITPASTSKLAETVESIDVVVNENPEPNTLGLLVSVGSTSKFGDVPPIAE